MAKIPQDMHAVIRHQVDHEGRKVAEVAAEYGCTSANIYAILTKTRRRDSDPGTAALSTSPRSAPALAMVAKTRKVKPAPPGTAPTDLFAGFGEDEPPPAPTAAGGPTKKAEPAKPAKASADRPAPKLKAAQSKPFRAQLPPPALEQPDRKGTPPKDAASSAARVKGKLGYALIMRTVDGEETVNPFRSLDELLSASKLLLRTAVRSAEPIWFSIQQVDLASLADDSV